MGTKVVKGRRESAILFSPVKANMDLTVVEFVLILENGFTWVNSQTRKKPKDFCQAMSSNPPTPPPFFVFFLFEKCGHLAQFFKMGEGVL